MAETRKQRLEHLKKELSIRKGIVKANRGFCREIKAEIEMLNHEKT